MSLYLGIVLFSFIFTSLSVVPYIDLLYRLHFTLRKPASSTPTGGGILLMLIIVFLFSILYILMSRFGVYIESTYAVKDEINTLLVTLMTFGLIGILGDLQGVFSKKHYFSLKNPLLLAASLCVAVMMSVGLHINYIFIPLIGVIQSPVAFILIATSIIYFFSVGANKVDTIDGLAGGSVLITMAALWLITMSHIDTPISLFISIWLGCLIAFLYFNVYPARILLGQAGAHTFGAMLAVIALLLGKPFVLFLICLPMLVANIGSLFKISFPAWLVNRGWPESKVMMRGWLLVLVSAAIGLWLG